MTSLRSLIGALLWVPCITVAGIGSASVEDEARALIGRERGPSLMGQQLVSDLSCTNQGSGTVAAWGHQYRGWSTTLADCQGRFVMLLERFLGTKNNEERRWRVVDARVLPEVEGIEFDPQKPEGAYLLTTDCYLDNKWGTSLYAVARLSHRKRMDWRTGVLGAWGYDMKQKRIVPLDTKRVVCHKPEPE